MAGSITVLCWHNVEATPAYPAPPGAGTDGFARQLDFLRSKANVVDLAAGVEALLTGHELPPRAVALTFDDGYLDNATVAAPMLRDAGLPATFFLSPGLLSRSSRPWWESLAWAFENRRTSRLHLGDDSLDVGDDPRGSYHRAAAWLKRVPEVEFDQRFDELVAQLSPAGSDPTPDLFADWTQATELEGDGLRIGAHGYHHVILTRLPDPEQERLIAAARRELRAIGECESIAYPNGERGDFDDVTIRAARAAGFRYGFSAIPGINRRSAEPFALRRVFARPEFGVGGLFREPVARGFRRLRSVARRATRRR